MGEKLGDAVLRRILNHTAPKSDVLRRHDRRSVLSNIERASDLRHKPVQDFCRTSIVHLVPTNANQNVTSL